MQTEVIDSSNDDNIDLRKYWRLLTRAKWGMLFITLICVIIGGFIAKNTTPIFQATSKLLADPTPPNAARDEQYVSSALVFLFFETQYEIIQSRAIAETVVDRLNLVERYKTEQGKRSTKEPNLIVQIQSALKAYITEGDTEERKGQSVRTDEDIRVLLAQSIQGGIKVTGGKQSQIINISYESEDPQLATDIINSISQAYIQFGLQSRLTEVKDTEAWLSEQSQELRANLSLAEERLKNFRLQQGVVDSNLQQRDANSRMQSLNQQLITAQTRLGEAQESFRQIEGVSANSDKFYSLATVQANRIAGDLVQELSRQESRVSELEKRYKDKHPKMIAARSELSSVQASLSREIAKIVEQIRRGYQNAQQQLRNIEDLIAREKESIQALQGSTSTLMTLEREVENSRRVYESFISKLMETNVRGEFNGSNISVIDYATVPNYPIKPRIPVIMMLSVFVGICLSIVFAIIKAALNSTFTTTAMVEEHLSIQVLGITHALDNKELKSSSAELKYLNDNRSVFAEGINSIRTGLQFSNIDNPPRLISITSSSGSEGKSTLSTNLAAAYSQLGKTLLMEVDLRKPSMSRNLDVQGKLGLTDVLSKAHPLEDCIFTPYKEHSLDVLVAGPLPHNPIELLSSDAFTNLITSLKQKYEYIILDGPPTLPVSDSIIIGNKVDAVIVAVRAGETKISAARETLKRLKSNNVNVLGGVLTIATPQKMSYYGDHYYGEGYYGSQN